MEIELIKPHSAIPSWYGYKYQGHIAFYNVLKIMNSLIEDSIHEKENTFDIGRVFLEFFPDVKEYSLEIEWMEDFSIKRDGKYVSFHQVKASDEVTVIKEEALFDVISKLKLYPHFYDGDETEQHVMGYFHVSEALKNDLSVADIDNYNKKIRELIDEIDKYLEMNCADRVGALSGKKGRKKNTVKKFVYDHLMIQNYRIEKGVDEKILEALEYIKRYINALMINDDENTFYLDRLKVSKERFDNMKEIEDCIVCEIQRFYSCINQGDFMSDDYARENIFTQFIFLLDRHIDNRKKVEQDIDISFSVFADLLLEGLTKPIDIKYGVHLFRRKLAESMADFIDEQCEADCEECCYCENVENCNLIRVIEVMMKLENKDFIKLMSNTAITRRIDKGLHELPSINEMHDTVYKFIKRLQPLTLNRTRISAIKDNKVYWCSSDVKAEDTIYVKRLMKNQRNILDVLFEADKIVTDEIEIPSDKLENMRITSLSDDDVSLLSHDLQKKYRLNKHNITHPNNIEVINFETAIGDLTND